MPNPYALPRAKRVAEPHVINTEKKKKKPLEIIWRDVDCQILLREKLTLKWE